MYTFEIDQIVQSKTLRLGSGKILSIDTQGMVSSDTSNGQYVDTHGYACNPGAKMAFVQFFNGSASRWLSFTDLRYSIVE